MSENIENAWVVVCLITANFQSSNECLKQLRYAQTHNKSVIPVIIESNFTPQGGLSYSIADIQHIKWGTVQPTDVAVKMSELFLRLRTLFTGQRPNPRELRQVRRAAVSPERGIAALRISPDRSSQNRNKSISRIKKS